MTTPQWEAMVLVGRIVRPHGNRGQVMVAPDTDFAETRFAPGSTVWYQRAGQTTSIVVTDCRMHDGRPIIGLTDVASINDAELFRGCELRVPEEALPQLAPGQFWHHQLVGCHVVTAAGQHVGDVVRIDDGATALLVVLGAVLQEFFARHASINSFTETVLRVQGRGEIKRWPARLGRRPLL